jgi:diketogulonate reductase-like aldo/keto reductase
MPGYSPEKVDAPAFCFWMKNASFVPIPELWHPSRYRGSMNAFEIAHRRRCMTQLHTHNETTSGLKIAISYALAPNPLGLA